jgi:tetratricopeptide (TPR) repeat protein
MTARLVAAIATTLGITLAAGLFLARQKHVPAAAHGAYVDSKLCQGCHARIYESYRRTGMGRSFYRPQPEAQLENTIEDYYHKPSDTHYAMLVREGKYYQRRWQIGFDGKETNIEEMQIDFAMGSGNHARAFLHSTKRGRLIELPLGWYAEKGGYWAMSPGYDVPGPATRRNVTYECMFCHNAYSHIPAGHEEPESEPVFEAHMPQGIDCQRCHGPGAEHVQAAQIPGARRDALRRSIVNPARLSADRRMEVCLQCHLETTSTRLPGLIRRFDRGPFSYVAGESLSDFVLSFDHAPGAGHGDKFEIAGSAYRLRQSQCFLKSGGALTCETCHDPHDVPRGEQAVKYYAARCRQCHAAVLDRLVPAGRHSPAAECAACHMPKRRTEDAVHVAMTDHLIQRRPLAQNPLAERPESNPTEADGYKGEVVPYYPASLANTGEGRLYLAVAQVADGSNPREGTARLTAAIEEQQPKAAGFYVALGSAWQRSGELGKAVARLDQASRLRPDSVGILRLLGIALKESGQLSQSANVLNRAVQIAPDDAPVWYELALLDSQQGRKVDAIAKMEKAIALDPDLLEPYNGLGVSLAANGELGRAEGAFRDALRINPYDATVHGSLARTLSSLGDLQQSVYHFEKAIRLRPNYAPDLYDYGLTLVRLERFAEAQRPVEEAVRVDPNLPQAHELLGGLFARKKQMDAALREFRQAVRLQPAFGRAQLDLGATLAGKGDVAGALPHLREAAKDPDPRVAQTALRALEQIGRMR